MLGGSGSVRARPKRRSRGGSPSPKRATCIRSRVGSRSSEPGYNQRHLPGATPKNHSRDVRPQHWGDEKSASTRASDASKPVRFCCAVPVPLAPTGRGVRGSASRGNETGGTRRRRKTDFPSPHPSTAWIEGLFAPPGGTGTRFEQFYDVSEEESLVVIRAIRQKPPHRTTEEIL
jgi:hypothetical protein